MSETRTSRTNTVNIETPDPASTVNLAELLGEVIGVMATGVGLLATEVRNAALLDMRPVAGVPNRAKAFEAGALPAIMPARGHSVRATPARIQASSSTAVQAELQAIVAAAPYVTRSRAQEISALATGVLAAPQGVQQATAITAFRSAVTKDFDQVTADTVLSRITTSLAEMKFTPVSIRAESGYVLARQGEHGPQIRIDVRHAAGGGVEIEADADGFQANSCQTALDQLEEKLKGKGVHLRSGFRRPKRNRYAAIRQAIRQR